VRLNLGAGRRTLDGWVNVDRVPLPGISTVLDLDQPDPWPWPDGTADAIEADNVFEHVVRPVWFMTECHRVLVPGGRLHIKTPHYTSRDSWTDPTHLRHCSEDSFAFWVPGNIHYEVNNAGYGGVAFSCRKLAVVGGMIDVLLAKIPRDVDPGPAAAG
jgi:SAM-dependent methyltransferase